MISLRLDRPLIYFDLETTGLDLYRDQIVQIAAIKYFKLPFKKQSVTHNIFNDCVKLDRYILPTCEIASEAIDVHKLTREKLIELKAKSFAETAKELYVFFNDCDLIGYNIKNFDIPLLYEEFKRCKYNLEYNSVIDVCEIFKRHVTRDLEGALKFYRRDYFDRSYNLHNAIDDVAATAQVFASQVAYHQLPRDSFEIADKYQSIDLQGKLNYNSDTDILSLTFGAHKGIDLCRVPKNYIENFLFDKNVLWYDAKKIVRKYLAHKR